MSGYFISSKNIATFAALGCALVIAGCGGGGGSSGGGGGGATTYTIGGSVTGLSGSGLVLQNNGGGNLSVAASGNFTFATAQANASSYAVTVATQPSNPSQTCTVANGAGNVSGANITNVAVTCVGTTFTVGGTLSGLNGTGLVLQNNGGDNLTANTNGAFVFNTALNNGSSYAVTVRTQPTAPIQTCTVTSGSGTNASGNVTNVAVVCANIVPRFGYTWNTTSNTLSSYWVDASTGELHARGYFKTGAVPFASVDIPIASDPNFVYTYTLNQGSADITAGRFNPTTGVYAAIAGSPFSVGTTPSGMASHPSGKFLFVAHSAANSISVYAVDTTTGALTAVAGSPFATGTTPMVPSFDASGAFMYVANQGSNNIYVYSINTTTGVPTEILADRIATGTAPRRFFFVPGGKFGYAVNSTSANISGYTVNSSTGALTAIAGSPFATGTTPFLAIPPNGRFLYTLNQGSSNVSGFAIDQTTGALSLLGGSPFATDSFPSSYTYDANFKYFYVGNFNSATPSNSIPGSISTFAVDTNTGVLTAAGSPTATGPSPRVTTDPSGKFIYAVSPITNSVYGYNINANTGALTAFTTAPVVAAGNTPQFGYISSGTAPVVAVPKHLYLATAPNTGNGNVVAYAMNATTGLLSIVGSPVATRVNPVSIATTPGAAYVYVLNETSNNISAYSSNNGVLTEITGSPFATATAPHYIAIDAAGRFAYVAHDATISMFAINSSTGALTTGATIAAGNFPETVAIDSNLRCVFAANNNSNNVSAYTVNTATGALTAATGSPFATGTFPIATTIDPTGRFLYVTNDGSNTVSAFTIAANGCGLTPVAGSPFPVSAATAGAVDIAVELHGKFAYVANEVTGAVTIYSINQTTGALSTVGTPVTFGSSASSVYPDASGKFLLVGGMLNNASSGVVYTINQSTGAIAPVAGSLLVVPSASASTLTGDIQ